MLDNISKNFFFKQSLILSGYFLMISIWPTFADICCPYFFSKDSRFQKCLLFFYPRFKLLWSRVQQNNPDEKSVGDSQTFKSNRGQQWLSRTGQIKICQGCSWGENFDWFLREKIRPFWSHIQWRGQLVGKTEIWPLWSTTAGDKEV